MSVGPAVLLSLQSLTADCGLRTADCDMHMLAQAVHLVPAD